MSDPRRAALTRRDLLRWGAAGCCCGLLAPAPAAPAAAAVPAGPSGEAAAGPVLRLDLLAPSRPAGLHVAHAGRRCTTAARRVIDVAPNDYCVDHDPVSGAPLGLAVGPHGAVTVSASLDMPIVRDAATIFCQARTADGRLVKRAYVWSATGYAIVENGTVIERQGEIG